MANLLIAILALVAAVSAVGVILVHQGLSPAVVVGGTVLGFVALVAIARWGDATARSITRLFVRPTAGGLH